MDWSGAGADDARGADAAIVRISRPNGEVDQTLGPIVSILIATRIASTSRITKLGLNNPGP